MDDTDILPNTVLVLYPNERKYPWLSAYVIIFVKSHLTVHHSLSFCFSKPFGHVI